MLVGKYLGRAAAIDRSAGAQSKINCKPR